MGKDWYEGCVSDQKWRLNHLYYIRSKEKGIVRFKMNWAQEYLFDNLHTRNTILKARQLGISTFTSIYILDCCLHQPYYEAGIVDKTDDDAKEKLRKIKIAYEFMLKPPPHVGEDYVEDEEDRKMIATWAKKVALNAGGMKEIDIEKRKRPIDTEGAEFGNGSIITTGTSLRGGTYAFMHVSEFASVAYHLPLKAKEILNGAGETVPSTGIIVMESTHEGAKSGLNYEILKGAMENESKPYLDALDYKFFFFTWWKQPDYRLRSRNPFDHRLDGYFRELEQQGIVLDEEQKRWYLAKERSLTDGMWTEYPSTPEEAFTAKVDGAIYGSIITRLRTEGRTNHLFETDDTAPLYVSWDLGTKDNTSMWLIQPGCDGRYYLLDYYSNTNRGTDFFLTKCQEWEREHKQLITCHYLPHDSSQRGRFDGLSVMQHFTERGLPAMHVPRTSDIWQGINATRTLLRHCVFHARCNKPIKDLEDPDKEHLSGVNCLETYHKQTTAANGVLKDQPVHDESSHGADALRIFAEAEKQGLVGRYGIRKRSKYEYGGEAYNTGLERATGVPAGW